MEPSILLVGRNLEVMAILTDELRKANRDVTYANSEELVRTRMNESTVDLVVVGAGLPDDIRTSLGAVMTELNPDVEIHMIERIRDGNPAKMIDFTNEKAVLWKVGKVLGAKSKKRT